MMSASEKFFLDNFASWPVIKFKRQCHSYANFLSFCYQLVCREQRGETCMIIDDATLCKLVDRRLATFPLGLVVDIDSFFYLSLLRHVMVGIFSFIAGFGQQKASLSYFSSFMVRLLERWIDTSQFHVVCPRLYHNINTTEK